MTTLHDRLQQQYGNDMYWGFYPYTTASTTEIMFGAYTNVDGSTVGEMAIEWEQFGDKTFARLRVYGDAWAVWTIACLDLMPRLVEAGKDITPDQFCKVLRSLGFRELRQ